VEVAGNLSVTGTDNVGITTASIWRVTSGFAGDAVPITSNWAAMDTPAGVGNMGTDVTETSGVFSFPVTGYWKCEGLSMHQFSNGAAYVYNQFYLTDDNGSNWREASNHFTNASTTGDYGSIYTMLLLDVTNTTNIKVRFHITQEDDSNLTLGNSGYLHTGVMFTRLGDT
jgi:hypothetical protein